MPEFFVRAEIEAVNDGVIVLKAGKKILRIPSKVHPSLFDTEIKKELKTGLILDANVFSFEKALPVTMDLKELFCEDADEVILTAYLTGGVISVNQKMLN